MLLSLTLENWMSFRDRTTFCLTAGRQRLHNHRLSRVDRYGLRILPVASIYGGNASGKTNLFRALSFAESLVTSGTQPGRDIPVKPFLLDEETAKQPTYFCFEILADDRCYEFGFIVTKTAVLEEWLVDISSSRERRIYHRREGNPNFDPSLEREEFLRFAFKGTRPNQLFLTNSVSQGIELLKPVYDWFDTKLVLLAPDSRFSAIGRFLDEGDPLYAKMKQALPRLDTGIASLGGLEVAIESLDLPEPVLRDIEEKVSADTTMTLIDDSTSRKITVSMREGKLITKRLVTFHTRSDGEAVQFELSQESDGSRRIIDLLPAFLDLTESQSSTVYVIDEIDRSLHPLLTRRLLETYLAQCNPKRRSQLLFTTHDLLLMDQHLLRRDEMWIAERGSSGASKLISLDEYEDVRSDKDVRKSYLRGRMGGIPKLLMECAID
jgi:AAA15 family ATPase/GTPase